jgi:hypothetical protein
MPRRGVSPKESHDHLAHSEETREAHRAKQPYASELDDRELEHAHKERRPVSPSPAPNPSKSKN